MSPVIITISRQLGSGGAYIGLQVARRLGISYVDREIVRQAARELQEEENNLSVREERLSSFWERLFRTISIGTPETGYLPPPFRVINDEELFEVEARIIRKIVAEKNAVIVGRGGFRILKGSPGLINVFLHASRDFRCRRVMDLYDIADTDQALARIRDADMLRKRFIEAMTGVDWTDALNYHLCVDTERAGFSAAIDMVLRVGSENVKMPTYAES